MVKEKDNEKYVCVTPINITEADELSFEESTIVPIEKDLIVVKEHKKVKQ